MKLCSGLILSVVPCWVASGAAAQVFDPAKVGGPPSGALAEYLLAGAGPVGAVIVLPSCDGMEPHLPPRRNRANPCSTAKTAPAVAR
jgi:hypothetical protein